MYSKPKYVSRSDNAFDLLEEQDEVDIRAEALELPLAQALHRMSFGSNGGAGSI